MLTSGQEPLLDWASASRTCGGQQECGDAIIVRSFPGGSLVGLVDGLGHGPEAAAAARAAVEVCAQDPAGAVSVLLQRCHTALSRTRGAAVSLLSLRDGILTWAGVGNVEAIVLRASDAGPRLEHLLLARGIVGQKLPRFEPRSVSVSTGDLLAAATDGVRPDFASRIDRSASPVDSVQRTLGEEGPLDDALVWMGFVKPPPEKP